VRPSRPEKLSFTGTGGEYFRIWVVNLLFTIATLGFYGAWAKVRRMKYFYNSTRLAGSNFDYHGKPESILKGRIIAAVLIIVQHLTQRYSPSLSVIVSVAFPIAMPWLLWKSLQFKLFNSSYRGVRFGFRGSAKMAYFVYLALPFFTMLTGGLLAPYMHQQIKKFQHEESRYGTTSFSFDGKPGGFYKVYLIALVVFVAGAFAIFYGLGFVKGFLVGYLGAEQVDMKHKIFLGSILIIAIVVFAYVMFGVLMTMIQNLIWNHTRLGGFRFVSEMKLGRVIFITFTNLIGIFMTMGLFTPFAKIRMMKYRVESVTLIPAGSLDEFVSDEKNDISSLGDGMADLLDFDIAL